MRWSVHKALVEQYLPETLEYYEDRCTGRINEKCFEEWEDPISEKEAERLYDMDTLKIQRTFFAVDYSRGFTGRGRE